MAMAGRYVVVSSIGKRVVGDSDGPADKPNGTSSDLPLSRTPCGPAWIYQKNAGNTEGGSRIGPETPEEVGTMSKKNMGSGIDEFLKEEGIFEEAQTEAIKEVVSWQLFAAMKKEKILKARMAEMLKTSRTQVDRLLNPKNDVTLSTLQRAIAMVSRRIKVKLV